MRAEQKAAEEQRLRNESEAATAAQRAAERAVMEAEASDAYELAMARGRRNALWGSEIRREAATLKQEEDSLRNRTLRGRRRGVPATVVAQSSRGGRHAEAVTEEEATLAAPSFGLQNEVRKRLRGWEPAVVRRRRRATSTRRSARHPPHAWPTRRASSSLLVRCFIIDLDHRAPLLGSRTQRRARIARSKERDALAGDRTSPKRGSTIPAGEPAGVRGGTERRRTASICQPQGPDEATDVPRSASRKASTASPDLLARVLQKQGSALPEQGKRHLSRRSLSGASTGAGGRASLEDLLDDEASDEDSEKGDAVSDEESDEGDESPSRCPGSSRPSSAQAPSKRASLCGPHRPSSAPSRSACSATSCNVHPMRSHGALHARMDVRTRRHQECQHALRA